MDPFAQMSQDIDQMFQGMLGDRSGRMNLFNRAGQVFMPTIDVKEKAKEIRVTAVLPGLEEKDIEVSLLGRALWIKGEKREEHEEEKGDVYQCERQYGAFERMIPLPVEIDAETFEIIATPGIDSLRLVWTCEAAPPV